MDSMCTRSVTETIFGQAAKLPTRQLPTCQDIFKAYCWNQKIVDHKESVAEQIKLLAEEVKDAYANSSIPTIDVHSIKVRIKRLISKVKELEKYPEGKRRAQTFQSKFKCFEELFDVCICKCFDAGVRVRSECSCPLPSKIPVLEWDFWIDQKTVRQMFIGEIDKETTAILDKRQKRKQQIAQSQEMSLLHVEVDNDSSDLESDEIVGDDELSERELSDDDECGTVQNRNRYEELCKAVDRCKISNRDTCIIVNAVLKDLNMLSSSTIIDPAKLRRQRKLFRDQVVKQHSDENSQLTCIGFDGKQDITLVKGSSCRRSITEEHYAIVSFPGNIYIDHVMPATSKAYDVTKEIMSVINDTNSVESLLAVVSDGTNNNTGKYGGIIRQLEENLGRPLQWLICLLHCNELPFRKFFATVDGGRTTGPSTSTGVIASALNYDPKDIPIANFLPIHGNVVDVADIVKRDLSTDQLYFLKACLAVQLGPQSSSDIPFLQNSLPGNISHARWLTKANRILRLYMSKDVPSERLRRVTNFIVKVYGPCWFKIKSNPSCQDGSRNFFYIIQLCQQLDEADQKIILPVLKNNNYFAHAENILLSGVGDVDENIRRFASDKILDARSRSTSSGIRLFDKSNIAVNFKAESYIDMVDWAQCHVTSPPVLSHVSNEQLQQNQHIIMNQFPCHSQAVERTVKDISAASAKVYGHYSRHGMILQSKKCRLELPKVDSKADFK